MHLIARSSSNDPSLRRPFSESPLWWEQARFFRDMGTDAWRHRVPYHGTNNVNIATSCAQIALAFMRDCIATGRDDGQPFAVVEIGTGIGRFGYYFVRALLELRQSLPGAGVSFVYWMTDAAESNLDFLRGHAPIAGLIRDDLLRLARYDPTAGELPVDLTETRFDRELVHSIDPLGQPAILIGNYLFDSLPVDLLRLAGHEIRLLHAGGSPNLSADAEMNQVLALDDLGIDLDWQPVRAPHYADANHDALLAELAGASTAAWASFPIAGLRCLDAASVLAPEGYLFMATDKGPLPEDTPLVVAEPRLTLHGGACSFSVNFPLLARYIAARGGWVASQSSRQSLTTVLFNTVAPWDALPNTDFWRRPALDEQGHAHLFALYQLLQADWKEIRPSLRQLLSFLHLARWDPRTLARLWPALRAGLGRSTAQQRRELAQGIERSLDLFYPVPGERSTIAEIAEWFFGWLGGDEDV